MEIWELVARESIRDLVARYNACGDAGRFDEMLALFTEDALLEVVPDVAARGREQIRSFFARAAQTDPRRTNAGVAPDASGAPRVLRHFTATHQIDVRDRETASGRCYFAVLTADGLDHWGRYVDHYARAEERWLFRSRRVSVDASVPGGWAARATALLRGD